MRPDARVGGAFVDIVAEMEHQIRMLGSHVLVGRVEARLVVLARGEREAQPLRHGFGSRHCSRAARRANRVPHGEAIPIPAVGLESGHFDMHGMGQFGRGNARAGSQDLPEHFVAGDFPTHAYVAGINSSAVERIRRKARPEHKPVRARIARGDSQSERIGAKGGPPVLPVGPRRSRGNRCQPDEVASSNCHAVILHRERAKKEGW